MRIDRGKPVDYLFLRVKNLLGILGAESGTIIWKAKNSTSSKPSKLDKAMMINFVCRMIDQNEKERFVHMAGSRTCLGWGEVNLQFVTGEWMGSQARRDMIVHSLFPERRWPSRLGFVHRTNELRLNRYIPEPLDDGRFRDEALVSLAGATHICRIGGRVWGRYTDIHTVLKSISLSGKMRVWTIIEVTTCLLMMGWQGGPLFISN